MVISMNEAEETLERRLVEGMSLFGRRVTDLESDYRRYHAEVVNWQTLNFAFLRAAFLGKTRAADYQAQTVRQKPRGADISANVAELKDSILKQMMYLKAFSEELRPTIDSTQQDMSAAA
jgi:hypothetical protein